MRSLSDSVGHVSVSASSPGTFSQNTHMTIIQSEEGKRVGHLYPHKSHECPRGGGRLGGKGFMEGIFLVNFLHM
jgi:hypothetical protein